MRRLHSQTLFVVTVVLLAFGLPSQGRIIYVDDDGNADFVTIQAAIDDANDADVILVAPGTYTGEGNRDIDFLGKAITLRSQDGPETCIIDAGGRHYVDDPEADPEPHRGFHFHSGEEANSVLQGLTITGGYLRWDSGGGIYCEKASPQIVDCIVTANVARWGGGMMISDSNAVIIDCTISANRAGSGGGISMAEGNVTLRNCLVIGSFAAGSAGGIGTGKCDFVLRNCTICENRADDWGAGLYCHSGSWNTGVLDNCILWNNETEDGYRNEIGLGSGILGSPHVELNRCIVQDHDDYGTDDLYGSWMSVDPCFAQPGRWEPPDIDYRSPWPHEVWVGGDYHLMSQAGRWAPATETWVQDDVTSLGIDAGDPCSPIGEESSPNGGVINLGAYGGTAEASQSYPGTTRVLYVDDDITGHSDGSSWTSAFTYLQDALEVADAREGPVEIRVAQGRYTPDQGDGITPGDPNDVFYVTGRMTLLGGYAGTAAIDPNQRDAGLYQTVLSGDLANDDDPATAPLDLLADPARVDNSRDIVVMEGYNAFSCLLDGFTIDAATQGPALLLRLCHASIENCTFTNNASGAVAVDLQGGHPQFVNCRFSRNAAANGAAIYTSGTRQRDPSPASFTVTQCSFVENYAIETGGAIVLRTDETFSLESCVFTANRAYRGGAAFLESWETVHVVNCLFAGNWAIESAGGICLEETDLKIASCTFAGNRATVGRAIASPSLYNTIITAANLILRDGGDELTYVQPRRRGWNNMEGTITFSNVEGGRYGEGNIDVDPFFANPGHWDTNDTPDDPNDDCFVVGDYHLKSHVGRWDPATAIWVQDDVTSPCIDAGDPNSPLGDEPSPNGGIINMGFYGGTAQASLSASESVIILD